MKCTCSVRAARSGRLLASLALILSACGARPTANPASAQTTVPAVGGSTNHTRAPAVAGLFYPKDPQGLTDTITRFLAAAPTSRLADLRAVIVPHAGYEYSGPTAAYAYQQLAGRGGDTVVILAASHYAAFHGVSVPATEAYETPLGRVPVSAKARELARNRPFVLEPRCLVRRPPWSAAASKTAPAIGEDTPETWEHSVEVQIPFLQRVLTNFAILPVVFGDADPLELAHALAPLLDDRTLVVASTDLSHYHPYDEARTKDRKTVQAVCKLDTDWLSGDDAEDAACGRLPVLTLLHLARLKGWQPHLLDYRNSGDTAGDKRGVVGYAAIAFTGPAPAAGSTTNARSSATAAQLSAPERDYLLRLARLTLTSVTAGRSPPKPDPAKAPAACRAVKGCFVTLTKAGELRGCIGNILPDGPLDQAVIQNARRAALEDPRFPPVTAAEARTLRIEISVLTVPEPLAFNSPEDLLARLEPHQDGVVLRIGDRVATFLPQVWEQLPEKTEFLDHLAAKSGSPASAWRGRDVRVSTYRVEAFAESR